MKKDIIYTILMALGFIILVGFIIWIASSNQEDHQQKLFHCIDKVKDAKWCIKNFY